MKVYLYILIVILLGLVLFGFQKTNNQTQEVSITMDEKYNNFPRATFAGGCFWCVESDFEKHDGVIAALSGYAGGKSDNPTYQQVSAGGTGHAEVVQVIYDPEQVSYEQLLAIFWESHNPTQGMRQGNDRGTQYRSGIYFHNADQQTVAQATRDRYQTELTQKGYGSITTEIIAAPEFYYAEDYHQQYLAKNPSGYCGLGGTGVTMPT